MKKFILSALSIILAIGMAGAGAFAYFSDVETSEDNTFTAGTLDLQVGGDNPVAHFEVDNLAPGWQESYSWTLKNVGSIPGYFSVEFSSITNNDNLCNDPETEAEVNEYGVASPGPGEGELGAYLRAWVLSDAYGSLNLDLFGLDAYSHNNQGYQFPDKTGASFGLNWLGGKTGYPATLLLADETVLVQLTLSLDADLWNRAQGWPYGTNYDIDDNVIQSDSVEFDIIFHLDQVP